MGQLPLQSKLSSLKEKFTIKLTTNCPVRSRTVLSGHGRLDKSGGSAIIEAESHEVALENQRYARNKETLVNKTYIESGEYKRKFDNATENKEVNKTLYDCAKTALKHRSGTAFEDMYWIDSDTGKIILSVTDSTDERAIVYSDKIRNIVL